MDSTGDSWAKTQHDLPTTDAGLGQTRPDDAGRDGGLPLISRGHALGRYLVIEPLGAGAMGVVYRAFDPDLDRSVALKLVGGLHEGSEGDDERARLLREAQAMARLSHPNVIPVFDVGILDDAVFVAMELVDGLTLRAWMAERPREPAEILPVFLDAGRGLAAAHDAGLVHRDFKPDNVMIGHDGRVRVLDFGLARATGAEPTRSAEVDEIRSSRRGSVGTSLDRSMTAAGAVMGTPAYMAPEQLMGEPAGAAADQFAFCIALFEALLGARPFSGTTMATLSMSVLQGKITMPPGSRGRAPGWVLAVLQRGLQVDAAERFPSMHELLEALSHDPARRRRRWWIGLGAAGVLGAGTLLGAAMTPEPEPVLEAPALCTGAEAAMTESWSPARADELGEAFAATGLAHAPPTWTRTRAELDAFAAAWVAEHTAACRATRVTGEQSTERLDLRMACLDRQRQQLGALLDELATPDPEVVARAIDAARRLPRPERCGELEALHTVTPEPEAPELRERLAELRREVDRVRSQVVLGHLIEARRRLDPLLPRVEGLDFPPLSAEVLDLAADLEADTGDLEVARRIGERAYVAATAAGDARLAASIARGQAFLVGNQLVHGEDGRHWVALSRASLRRLGGDGELEARLASAEGAIEVAAGHYAEALRAHARAREHWQARAPSGPDLAAVLDDIGAVHVVRGELDEAIALHRESLRLKELSYGPDHPQVAASLRELGSALSHAERYDEALEQFERGLAIDRATRGEHNRSVAVALDDIGRVLRRQGKLGEAIEHHRRALAIWEAVLGDPHPDLAVSLLNVGYTLVAAERFEDALVELRRALAMFEATVGPSHPYIVYASNSVASTLIDLGRYDEARPHLERVLAIEGLEVDPTLIAETRFMLAHALWADGGASAPERSRARELAREALAGYRTQAERWGPQIEQIEAWLAEHG
ncbi:MAG: serine/threonine protein kinase [Myxococcales bacterium]|nr:serine/threonine protein kinase [Myxococcales bacterium]MCB9715153.1 serine/threonine protein kinase [Myxococcales bacterium]